MKNCTFCVSIHTYEKATKVALKGFYMPQMNIDSIVYDKINDTFDFWTDGNGDSFMACAYLEDIKFCPKCGRELRKVDMNS